MAEDGQMKSKEIIKRSKELVEGRERLDDLEISSKLVGG